MKKMILQASACFLLLVGIAMTGCSVKKRSRVSPPSATLDIPFEKFRYLGDSGTRIRLSTGTEIRIEPGSLIDENGKPVRGEIEFRVREFHRTEDLFRAGIPLNTRANGSQQLQSAGMIEMRAFAGNQELQVAKEKSLGVGLASYRDGKGYDLWYMEQDADWNVRGSFRTDSNRRKQETIRLLNDTINQPESPMREEARIFELVGNVELLPYLKAYEKLKWRLDDSEPLSRLETDSRVHWEKVQVEPVNKKKNLFRITFVQFDRNYPGAEPGIKKSILASPLSSRNDLKKRMAAYEKEMAAFEKQRRERLEQLSRIQKEADLLQYFSADRMGIWNIDRLMKMEDCVPVNVHFDFEKTIKSNDLPIRLIALYDGDNSVMEYAPAGWKAVYLQKGKPMRLIALLPNDQLALVDNANIQFELEQGKTEIRFQTKRFSAKEFLKTTAP